MRRNIAVASISVALVLAIVCLACCPENSFAQRSSVMPSGPSGPPPGSMSGPPPGSMSAHPSGPPSTDQMVYFRPGPKEKWVGVTAINAGYPGMPGNFTDLRQTSSMVRNLGYNWPRDPSRAGIQVRVTAIYSQMPIADAPSAPRYSAPGGVLGAVTGLLFGVGGPGPATPASPPPMVSILTLEFNISSRGGGQQFGRITRDVTGLPVPPEQYIDAAIADYLHTALPRR